MNALRQLAFEHAEAAGRGVEVERVRAERAAAGLARRRFLAGVGAAAGAALLAPARPARAGAQPRIAIIGGGIAGLTAALTLKDAGLSATIYEAATRIGGRMHSNVTWADNQVSEWCGEFIDSEHATILQLVDRFGVTLDDEIAAEPAGSADTLFFDGRYYDPADADRDFRPVYATLKSQLKAAPSTSYKTSTAFGQYLDSISVHKWIELFVPGGQRSQLGRYLDSAYTQEYGLDTREQSSLNLVYLLGYQPKPASKPRMLQIYGPSDQRYHIRGGNELLPRAIADSLPDGAIATGRRLTRIERRPSGAYALTFDGAPTVVADQVILTLPFSVLRRLDYSGAGFDSLKTVAINELGYGTNSKLALQFDQRYWNGRGAWGVSTGGIYTDLDFQNTWDSARGAPGASGLLVAYPGGRNGASFTGAASPYAVFDRGQPGGSDPAVRRYAKALLPQLDIVWPGVSPHWSGRATLSAPWRDPNLLGSYSCWKVGQYTKFAGYEGKRQGRCHFAGEHCSTDFQGYMEGAAAEGVRAANEILAEHMAAAAP
jgi:monoamine oxidase